MGPQIRAELIAERARTHQEAAPALLAYLERLDPEAAAAAREKFAAVIAAGFPSHDARTARLTEELFREINKRLLPRGFVCGGLLEQGEGGGGFPIRVLPLGGPAGVP